MEKLFKLNEHGTNVKTELIAGLTTFLSMVYILAVNPNVLSAAGMDRDAVFTATAISAALATLCMAFLANYPVVLASGMGLNAYFAYSICVPMAQAGIADPWKIALTAVLCEGIIFILLSFFKFRETLVNKIPANLKLGITVGIGLFITLVGLSGAGIVVSDSDVIVGLGSLSSPNLVLAMTGLIAIGIFHHFKITGGILWGILLTWLLGIAAQLCGWYVVDPALSNQSLIPDLSAIGSMPAAPSLFQFNFSYVAEHLLDFVLIVFSFLFVDLFDTVGVLIGVAEKGKLLDKNGNLPRVGRALLSDAIGTTAGACLGVSTVTSYIDSGTGISVGGRTGLTALTAAVMFLLSLFFAPIFLAVPGFATAPALIFVGLTMMGTIKKMTFDGDIADVLGGFMAIIMMPFTYSIANGIMFGMLFWIILKICTGKIRDIHPIMWCSGVLFALNIGIKILGK
ncbi:MAG: NCS2 family permease [Oscillospiraceae bacterium]|jgi:AGZA family xanthine/uracil permease-like MFS transporter|nr:NCS2 family permease [Oscillospiraceae bacterium]